MKRSHLSLLLLAVLALVLSACVAQAPAAPAAEEEQMEAEATPMAAEEAEAGSEAEFERLLACVEENFPAESYFTNDLLPAADATWEPMDCTSVDSIKVGMPWVLNDEEAPWYNAIELGFFADVCLEIELVAGGPGVDHSADARRRRCRHRRRSRRKPRALHRFQPHSCRCRGRRHFP